MRNGQNPGAKEEFRDKKHGWAYSFHRAGLKKGAAASGAYFYLVTSYASRTCKKEEEGAKKGGSDRRRRTIQGMGGLERLVINNALNPQPGPPPKGPS